MTETSVHVQPERTLLWHDDIHAARPRMWRVPCASASAASSRAAAAARKSRAASRPLRSDFPKRAERARRCRSAKAGRAAAERNGDGISQTRCTPLPREQRICAASLGREWGGGGVFCFFMLEK